MCWAAKWFGKSRVEFDSVHHSSTEQMVKRIYDLVDEADAIVHYNGTKFDMPILKREFLDQGLPPPNPWTDIDLLKTVRREFRLPSNKLDYVAQHLGLAGKTKHMGMQMWRDCMDGCPKAWATMKKYNIQDVRLLEQVYEVLLPWIKSHPNKGHFTASHGLVCPRCGHDHVIKAGKETRTIIPYQRYRCTSCNGLMKGERLDSEPRPLAKAI